MPRIDQLSPMHRIGLFFSVNTRPAETCENGPIPKPGDCDYIEAVKPETQFESILCQKRSLS